jgi:hypothetical protein
MDGQRRSKVITALAIMLFGIWCLGFFAGPFHFGNADDAKTSAAAPCTAMGELSPLSARVKCASQHRGD